MIILGVDFGDSRTGLAVCDKSEMVASRAGCIQGGFKKALEGTAKTAKDLKAELIVVGNPINMNGTEGPRSAKCRDFAAELEALCGIKTVLYDERLTTVTAHSFLTMSGVDSRQHKKHVDELSARLILEDYMKLRKNRGEI
ncbi:MAG: Holliday junction resolvase RuvX [Clostridia bacterium]|nr:Holliday junction resolvase RuvX [Clostridia bacterium]